jgi:hypothetical protein
MEKKDRLRKLYQEALDLSFSGFSITEYSEVPTYKVDEISDEASFLEMLDYLNEQLITDGKEAIVFDHDCRDSIPLYF